MLSVAVLACLTHRQLTYPPAPGRGRPPGLRSSRLLACRRLEQNFFNCSCDIRWMQLWQEQGEAKLNSQNLYCISADGAQLPLSRMNISQCGEGAPPWPREGGPPRPELSPPGHSCPS